MFNLWGKIRLDGTEAKRDAANIGQGIGKEVGQQFHSTVRRFIGAGALIGMFRNAMDKAMEITAGSRRAGASVEGYQELQRASKLTGLSIEELQTAGKTNPMEFARLMKDIQDQGGLLDREAVKDLRESAMKVDRASNRIGAGTGKTAGFLAGSLEETDRAFRGIRQMLDATVAGDPAAHARGYAQFQAAQGWGANWLNKNLLPSSMQLPTLPSPQAAEVITTAADKLVDAVNKSAAQAKADAEKLRNTLSP